MAYIDLREARVSQFCAMYPHYEHGTKYAAQDDMKIECSTADAGIECGRRGITLSRCRASYRV